MTTSRFLPAMFVALLASTALGGCVTKKQYQADLDAAQHQLEQSNATLEDAHRTTLATLSEVLEEAERQSLEAKRNIASLEERIAALQQQLDSTEAQRAELESSLTSSLSDKAKLKASVAALNAALAAQNARNVMAESRVAEFKRMLERFKPLIDAGRLDIRIVDGRMVLQLPSDVLFATGSAQLSNEGAATISEVGAILATIPDRAFQVEGHTDNVPIRTKQFKNNWELGSARALTVVSVLIESGLAPNQVSGAAYADTQPRTGNDSDDGRARNRRIEIAVIPDLSSLPGFDELQKLAK